MKKSFSKGTVRGVQYGMGMKSRAAPDHLYCQESEAKYIALYDYDGNYDDELTFRLDDIIIEVKGREAPEGWMYGKLQASSKTGLVPMNYVQKQ